MLAGLVAVMTGAVVSKVTGSAVLAAEMFGTVAVSVTVAVKERLPGASALVVRSMKVAVTSPAERVAEAT